jgi:hypothetical protein
MQKSIRFIVNNLFLRRMVVAGVACALAVIASNRATAEDTSVKRIYEFIVSNYAGQTGNSGTQDGGATSAAQFNLPSDVCMDADKGVFVADFGNHTIRRIVNGQVTTFLGVSEIPGFANGKSPAALFNGPSGLTMDAYSGEMYISDFNNNAIRKVLFSWKGSELVGFLSTYSGLSGNPGTLDGVLEVAQFNGPMGIASDAYGSVYVADYNNHSIRQLSVAGDVITFAGVTGTSGYKDGDATSPALLNHPTGVAVDASGVVYVADSGNFVVRKVLPDGTVSTYAGQPGVAGSADGLANEATFSALRGISLDSDGNVYVTDNNTARMITTDGRVMTLAGSSSVPGTNNGQGTNVFFNGPAGLFFGSANSGCIADQSNHVIRVFLRKDTTPIPSGYEGSTLFYGKQGQYMSVALPFTGFRPMTFTSTPLPDGLTLDANSGIIYGIPSIFGTAKVTVTGTNPYGVFTQTITIILDPSVPVITSATQINATASTLMSYTITATESPTRFWATGQPLLLAVDSSTGVMKGMPLMEGEYDFTVYAQNAYATTSTNVHISVDPPTVTELIITNVVASYSYPYLVDFGFNLFDRKGRAIVLPPTDFTVQAYENMSKVDPISSGVLLQTNSKIMKAGLVMDYAASMQNNLPDSNKNGLSDYIDKMQSLACDFVTYAPANAKVSIVEFHADDAVPSAVVKFPDANSVWGPAYLTNAINNINATTVHIFFSGSRLWDGIQTMLSSYSSTPVLNENRFVVVFADGNDTSSTIVGSKPVDELTKLAVTNRVKLYFVMFGNGDTNNFNTLAKNTGGGFYRSTDTNLISLWASLDKDSLTTYNLRWATLNRSTNALQMAFSLKTQGVTGYFNTNTMPPVTNIVMKTNSDGSASMITNYSWIVTNSDNTTTNYTSTNVPSEGTNYTTIVGTNYSTNLSGTNILIDNFVPTQWAPVTTSTLSTNSQPGYAFFGTNAWLGSNTTAAVAQSNNVNLYFGRLRLTNEGWVFPRVITLTADFMPRYIRQFHIHYRPNWPCTPQLLNNDYGEIMEDWHMYQTSDGAGGYWLTIQAPDTSNLNYSIPFAAEGPLVQFTFKDMIDTKQAFSMFVLDNTVYTNMSPAISNAVLSTASSFIANYPALPNGTPWAWLLNYGIVNANNQIKLTSNGSFTTTTNYALAETSDFDGDGVANWLEYFAGSNPTDKFSTLQLIGKDFTSPGMVYPLVAFPSSTNRTYELQGSSNLTSWTTLVTSISGAVGGSSSNSIPTNLSATAQTGLYVLKGTASTNWINIASPVGGTNGMIWVMDPRAKLTQPTMQFYRVLSW